MNLIPLTRGLFAQVDHDVFVELSRYSWCAQRSGNTWYAVRTINRKPRKQYLRMHHEVMELPGFVKIDHRDGDGLNNCRANLRPATQAQNQQNSKKRTGCSSRFKGVSWYKNHQKWVARIRVNGKIENLGSFSDEKKAAEAYDARAKAAFGDYARPNF